MTNHKFFSPLFYPLIGLVSGIYFQSCLAIPILIMITLCVIFLSILIINLITQKTKSARVAATFLFFSVGGILLVNKTLLYESQISMLSNKKTQMMATVTDKNEWGEQTRGDALKLSIQSVYIPKEQQHYDLNFNLLCYFKHYTKICVGDTILLQDVILKSPKTSTHQNNSSFTNYLQKENLLASVFLTPKQYKLLARPIWNLSRWVWNIRNKLYQKIKHKLTPKTFNYFGLIFLGNKQQKSILKLRRKFSYWGLAHYLARSGIHIVLFIILLTFLLRFIPIHINFKRILLLILCLIYSILSWTSLSFTRALFAFLLAKIGELWSQQINYLHLITLICFFILLFNPMQLFFLDFQLTFTLTFSIIFISYFLSYKKQNLSTHK